MILCSGCFDGLHAGHIDYLHAAAALNPNEYVYVAVAPDAYIDTVKKRQPFWPAEDRARAVKALAVVHNVCTGDAVDAIRTWRPRLFVKGLDWAGHLPQDVRAACYEVGAVIVYVDTPGRHTSEALG